MLVPSLPFTNCPGEFPSQVCSHSPGFSSNSASTSSSCTRKDSSLESTTNPVEKPRPNTTYAFTDGNLHEYSETWNHRTQDSNAYIAANLVFIKKNLKSHSKKLHSLQTFKRSNNVVEALSLPTFGNMTPISV